MPPLAGSPLFPMAHVGPILPRGEVKGPNRPYGSRRRKGWWHPFPSPIRPPPLWGVHQPLVGWLASLLWPIWPISFPGGSGNPRYSKTHPNQPEPFRYPNVTFQYMNLYVSTISRLLIMSVISSGTPNKLRPPKHITHNTNRHRTLSVRTLRVREPCRHDRDTSPVNNQ